MSTPEGQPKNYISTGINKSLLTPCRRVGLSRSKKTPISLLGLHRKDTSTLLENKETHMLDTHEITGTPIKSDSVDFQIEVNHKIAQSNKKIKKDTLRSIANEKLDAATAKTISHAKKEKLASVKNMNVHKNTKIEHKSVNEEEIKAFSESEMKPDNRRNIGAVTGTHCDGIAANSILKLPEENSLICSTKISTKDKSILKPSNSNLSDECLHITRKKRKFLDSDNGNDKKSLTKFTTEEYLTDYSRSPHTFVKNLGGGNDDLVEFTIDNTINKTIKKEYVAINCPLISTKSDNKNENQGSTKKIKVDTSAESKISCDTKLKSKKSWKQTSKFDTEDSDDDIFSPSPQSCQTQKENLLKRITETKNIVKQKEETLEKMKRAQIYRDKHSPLEVKKSTNVWKIACEQSLKDLHLKMQEHGPIEMNTLIKKIGIPDYILKELKLD